jgi:hypothetical protein
MDILGECGGAGTIDPEPRQQPPGPNGQPLEDRTAVGRARNLKGCRNQDACQTQTSPGMNKSAAELAGREFEFADEDMTEPDGRTR